MEAKKVKIWESGIRKKKGNKEVGEEKSKTTARGREW